MNKEYAFIIDTDAYAGNFERQMCAYITGQYGECGVADDIALQAVKDLGKTAKWFEQNVVHKPDDHGCSRPVAIEPTPGFWNDGHGGAYTDQDDPKKVRARYEKTVSNYYGDLIKRAEARVKAGEKAWARDIKSNKQTIADSIKRGPGRFPSYQSIIVYLDAPPPPKIRTLIADRAKEFANNPEKCGEKYQEPFKILNVRFVEISTIQKSI